MMARVEPRIGDHLAALTQNLWLWHLHQEQGSQRFTDTDDAEQQVATAAQFSVLIDCLADSSVDGFELAGEMLDRGGGQLGRDAIAETAADAVFPLRPVLDDAGTHGLQFTQSSHRRRWR